MEGKVSTIALSQYENALISPSPEVQAALRQALALPPEYFAKELGKHNFIALCKFGPAFCTRTDPSRAMWLRGIYARHVELVAI